MEKVDGTTQVPTNKVSSRSLQLLSKEKVIELLLETTDDYKKLSILRS